jgi:hypothetical protein
MALEEEIQAAEARLGLALPTSYRTHLLASAGLPGDQGLVLLPVEGIERFALREPEWFAAWMDGYNSGVRPLEPIEPLPNDPDDPATMPAGQLGDTIVISTTADMRLLLLNPSRIDPAGEWEAWDFANWYPGAYRYPSFAHLVDALASRGW